MPTFLISVTLFMIEVKLFQKSSRPITFEGHGGTFEDQDQDLFFHELFYHGATF